MGDRVEGQAAQVARGRIAEPVGREGVRELVDGNGDKEQDRGDEQDRQELGGVRQDVHGCPSDALEELALLGLELLRRDGALVLQLGQSGEHVGGCLA